MSTPSPAKNRPTILGKRSERPPSEEILREKKEAKREEPPMTIYDAIYFLGMTQGAQGIISSQRSGLDKPGESEDERFIRASVEGAINGYTGRLPAFLELLSKEPPAKPGSAIWKLRAVLRIKQ